MKFLILKNPPRPLASRRVEAYLTILGVRGWASTRTPPRFLFRTHQLPGLHKTASNTYFPVSNLQFSSMFHRFSLNSKNPVSKQASHLPRTSQNSLRYLVPGLQYPIFIGFSSIFNDSQASSLQVASAGAAKRKQFLTHYNLQEKRKYHFTNF